MRVKFVMKEPRLEMEAHFNTFYYRQKALTIFSATVGREVKAEEIEVVEIK